MGSTRRTPACAPRCRPSTPLTIPVGIGGDYDGSDDVPEGLEDVSCYPALIAELLARGWDRDECVALTGGNVLRVMREAEAVSRTLSTERGPSTASIEELDRA